MADLTSLPPVVDLWPTAGQMLGLGRSSTYAMAADGTWPTRLLRLGKLIKVPTAELLALVGVSDDGPEAA